MKPYGYRPKEEWYETFENPRKLALKTPERMKQKEFCRKVIKETPPILSNGFNHVCRENHEDPYENWACVEEEVAIIPDSEEY